MGQTKTAIITELTEQTKTGEEKYRQRQLRKKAEEAKNKRQVKGVGLKGGERIKAVVGEIIEEKPKEEAPSAKAMAGRGKPRVRGKKYNDARAKVDKTKLYPLSDAVKLVKETSYSAFDGTVEMHLVVKKYGLSVNVELPHSAGKKQKVEVADDNTIKKLKKGKIDFDVLLATPDMMPKLIPFAKFLGPKGLMPNPKNGTLIKDTKDAKKFSANSQTLKTEKKAPIIHTTVGKVSQKESELVDNTQAIIDAVTPRQILKAYLTSTMGPSVKLAI